MLTPNQLADGAIVVYRASDKKFILIYTDYFATNPLSAFSQADDIHVPTSQNVQQFVNNVGQLLQDQIDAIQTGITHGIAVIDIANAPTSSNTGDRFIVDTAPTGAFAGHAGDIAEMVLGSWVFNKPSVGDSHFVDARQLSAIWNGTAWIAGARQNRTSLQPNAPTNALPGDTWLDNSGAKLEIKYWNGTAWITSAGTRTFTQIIDPASVATNQVKDGDVWIQLFAPTGTPPVTPSPITKVRQGGAWTTTTPTVPASSRTFIQHAQPLGMVLGDQWIDLTGAKPEVQYFDGNAWVNSGGTRSFTSTTDPALVTTNQIHEGDIWTDNTDPAKPKIYQRQGTQWILMNGGGSTYVPEAPPQPVKGVWFRRFNRADGDATVFPNWGDKDSIWTMPNQDRYCPVPAKYKTASDHFKITIAFRTDKKCDGNPLLEFYYEDNGSYCKDTRYVHVSDDKIAGSSVFFCNGNTHAMQWMNVRLTGGNVLPWDAVSDVVITWELLNV
jgi:hypothetical protein